LGSQEKGGVLHLQGEGWLGMRQWRIHGTDLGQVEIKEIAWRR
jgi:hypothetical protein